MLMFKQNQKHFFKIFMLLLIIDASEGGPTVGVSCAAVCTAAWAACLGGGSIATVVGGPAGVLIASCFVKGCSAGYAACLKVCLATLLAPTP